MHNQDSLHLDSMSDSVINSDGTGILLVDKEQGMTSHDVVARARKLTGIKRIGHTGTLDPLATGLLIVLIGRSYTKLQSSFLKLDKEYVCTAELGYTTDTYDSQGKTMSQAGWEAIATITRDDLEQAMTFFTGKIEQQVPAYSAVKVKGNKLYDLARKKQPLPQLPIREVTIHRIALGTFEMNRAKQKATFSIRAFVSSGTYIRSLIHDIGQKMGVGATVTSLRRTKIAHFDIVDAKKIEAYF